MLDLMDFWILLQSYPYNRITYWHMDVLWKHFSWIHSEVSGGPALVLCIYVLVYYIVPSVVLAQYSLTPLDCFCRVMLVQCIHLQQSESRSTVLLFCFYYPSLHFSGVSQPKCPEPPFFFFFTTRARKFHYALTIAERWHLRWV